MDNYKEMYLHLFNEVTKAIEILKDAQCQCEEIFISTKEKKSRKKPSSQIIITARHTKKAYGFYSIRFFN